jgi:hypothetical protein
MSEQDIQNMVKRFQKAAVTKKKVAMTEGEVFKYLDMNPLGESCGLEVAPLKYLRERLEVWFSQCSHPCHVHSPSCHRLPRRIVLLLVALRRRRLLVRAFG